MKYYDKNLKEIDLTDVVLHQEKHKREAALAMAEEQIYHMIWYGDRPAQTLGILAGHIEKRDVTVEDIFDMFPEISPDFFKHFEVKEATFRFKGGTVTFIRKES